MKNRSPAVWFHTHATSYVLAQILFHLNEVGVFRCIDRRGVTTIDDIANELLLDRDVLGVLLEYVARVDHLVEIDSGEVRVTSFGKEVFDRYGRGSAGNREFNFFDVRVGAYGPVWSGLGTLLSEGKDAYGDKVIRRGEYAERGVLKSSGQLAKSIETAIQQTGVKHVVEIGINSDLLEILAQKDRGLNVYGIDRNEDLIRQRANCAASANGQHRWIHADFFNLGQWADQVPSDEGVLIFSVHFHELLKDGVDKLASVLQKVRTQFSEVYLLALEQPMLPSKTRDQVDEFLWLYSQSNILIHHLIGNGKILSENAWRSLFTDSGFKIDSVFETGFLGYQAFLSSSVRKR